MAVKIQKRELLGTLPENTISKLRTNNILYDIPNHVGNDIEKRYFNIALELCITWMNRILFLKLLEAQLYSYHKNKNTLFLNSHLLYDYDELNNLFFQVLATVPEAREIKLMEKFAHVPYLNSSLFERTKLERTAIDISGLDNKHSIPMFTKTILKDEKGKRLKSSLPAIEYLFRFLDSYDFTSIGKAEIQEENKTLINASVLGLIFEKINGYKDGSFFTPGFITMYMCRHTLRMAVVEKFKTVNGWDIHSYDQLYEKIKKIAQANSIINTLTICDPAVGSGHFLVSALNELIAIKADLKILQDRNGKWLKEYAVEVINDELIIMDDEGDPFRTDPVTRKANESKKLYFMKKKRLLRIVYSEWTSIPIV